MWAENCSHLDNWYVRFKSAYTQFSPHDVRVDAKQVFKAVALNSFSKEEVGVDGKREVDAHHNDGCRVNNILHVPGPLHVGLQRNNLTRGGNIGESMYLQSVILPGGPVGPPKHLHNVQSVCSPLRTLYCNILSTTTQQVSTVPFTSKTSLVC